VAALVASDLYTVVGFSSGSELLQNLDKPCPGCVLLDLAMPGETGIDISRQLREIAPHLPIILVTAHGSVGARYQAMRCGAVGFIDKPYEPINLQKTILAAVRVGHDWWEAQRFRSRVEVLPEPAQTVLLTRLRGATTNEAARLLNMSRVRLQSYLHGAFEMLGVSSIEAIRSGMDKNR
jgi:FixJ family two-component response regulator